jgi:predicted transcriptional regulator
MNDDPVRFHPDRALRRFQRQFALTLTLKHALLLVTCWCFAWGTAALILRATVQMPRRPLLWGAVGVVAAVIAAAVWARRQLPSRDTVRALLDERNACGGLLMASADAEIGAWQTPAVALPRLRFRNSRAWSGLAGSAAFVAISLLVPIRLAGADAARPMDVAKETETLAARIEALQDAQILEEAKADELDEKLKQLEADASGEDPARTWEALDHLADAVEKTTKDAVEAAQVQERKLDQAEALAEGFMAGQDQLDAQTMTEAMQTLSAMMQGAMKENEALAQSLSPETKEALKSGALKPEHLKEIAQAAGKHKSALNSKLSKLAKSGAINPNALKGGAKGNKRDNAGLAQFLKENAQKMSVEEAVAGWCENPGKGTPSRGRADAAMTWTDGSSEKNAKFKEKILPPASVAGLNESELVGMSAAAPTVDQTAVAAHGALNRAATGGGSAHTQTVLPRHKGAVKRYFERQKR